MSRSSLTMCFALVVASAAADVHAQGFVLHQKDGVAADDRLGRAVASVGDVDGDGRADFIVGAYNAGPRDINGSGAGAAYVYSGATGAILYEKHGPSAGDQFGFSVAGAGDVNGDGRPDFIVGAHATGSGAGAAYVYSGATGALLYQKSGGASGDLLGYSVGSAGDVNGDGKADFIVGAAFASPGALFNAGSAIVYSGATGALLYQKDGAAAGDMLGYAVGPAGDVNGDGRADFIVGAPQAHVGSFINNVGAAYVYSGANGSLLYEKDGPATGDLFGTSVASAGDVNGDGRADFIVGANNAAPAGRTSAGSAFVYSGATGVLLFEKDGAAPGDNFGYSVASAGDVNGDGKADVIVGANSADPGGRLSAGSAYVYSGVTGALLLQRDGSSPGDQMGVAVASAGDANGDARLDLVLGASAASPGGRLSAGSAFVVSFVAPGLSAPAPSHASRFVLMPLAPNPTHGSGMASYLVPSAAAIRLSVCDIQGREVSLLDEGERAEGLHRVPLDATRLRPGLYFMRLTGGGVDLRQRVVIAR